MTNLVPATQRSLLLQLPPEILSHIIQEVVRTSTMIVRVLPSSNLRWQHLSCLAETALFTVNSHISREAMDAFFDLNTFRIVNQNDIPYLHRVRQLEVSDVGALWLCGVDFSDFQIDKLALLPKLRTVTISTDLIASWRDTVRRRLGSSKGTSQLVCVDVGLYELMQVTRPDVKIFLKNDRVHRAYPAAKAMALNGTIASLVNSIWEHRSARQQESPSDRTISDHWLHPHLALWLVCYDASRAASRDSENEDHGLTRDEMEILLDFQEQRFVSSKFVPFKSSLLTSEVEVEGLDSALHGHELLEWASELLALNMQSILKYSGYQFSR